MVPTSMEKLAQPEIRKFKKQFSAGQAALEWLLLPSS